MSKHADRDRSEPYWPPAARAAHLDEPVPYVPTERTGLPEYLDAIRAGADATPTPENAWPTAGQLWHQLLEAPVDDRLDRLGRYLDAAAEVAAQPMWGAIASVTPCSCSAQRSRAEAAERALADERAKVADLRNVLAHIDPTHPDAKETKR